MYGRHSLSPILIAMLLLALGSSVAAAQAKPVDEAPPNSHESAYGGGWDCDRGYQRIQQSCLALVVPSNAYLDSSGDGWACERGFRKLKDGCIEIDLPPHAFLGASGNRWECQRGYRKAEQSCEVIDIPASAYLDASGGYIYGEFWGMELGKVRTRELREARSGWGGERGIRGTPHCPAE